MEISETLTRKLAHLARLELPDAEVTTFTAQLGLILDYVGKLKEVSIQSDVKSNGELETPLREDVVRPSLLNSGGMPKMLEPAPEVIDGGFKVPPIL